MKIDRNNYEQFIIDYIEGRLNSIENKIVNQFIYENPDIAEEIKNVRSNIITDNEIRHIDRTKIYRSFSDISEITDSNFEEFCIAYLENDLDSISNDHLLNYIGNDPENVEEFEFYQKIKIKADVNIIFSNKRKLKKQVYSRYRSVIYFSLIAASILLIIILRNYHIGTTDNNNLNNQIQKIALNKSNIVVKSTEQTKTIRIQSVSHKIKNKNYQMAVFDTNNPYVRDKVKLAELIPHSIIVNSNKLEDNLKLIELTEIDNKNRYLGTNENYSTKKDERAVQKSHERLFLRALQLGFKGVSKMTESNLVMDTKLDKQGNLAEIEISAGGFEISRKLNTYPEKN
jgi:hypothetical protein